MSKSDLKAPHFNKNFARGSQLQIRLCFGFSITKGTPCEKHNFTMRRVNNAHESPSASIGESAVPRRASVQRVHGGAKKTHQTFRPAIHETITSATAWLLTFMYMPLPISMGTAMRRPACAMAPDKCAFIPPKISKKAGARKGAR